MELFDDAVESLLDGVQSDLDGVVVLVAHGRSPGSFGQASMTRGYLMRYALVILLVSATIAVLAPLAGAAERVTCDRAKPKTCYTKLVKARNIKEPISLRELESVSTNFCDNDVDAMGVYVEAQATIGTPKRQIVNQGSSLADAFCSRARIPFAAVVLDTFGATLPRPPKYR